MKSTLEGIFGETFGEILDLTNELRPGQEVMAKTGPDTLIRGKLVSNPTELFPFCVINGTITCLGVSKNNDRLLAPKDLVKAVK